jgi:hypothetical protein
MRIVSYPGISGCDMDFCHIRILTKGPDDGVLTSTGSEYKNLHVHDPIDSTPRDPDDLGPKELNELVKLEFGQLRDNELSILRI